MKKLVFAICMLYSTSCNSAQTNHQESCDALLNLMCVKVATCTPMPYTECMSEMTKGGCGDNTTEALDQCSIQILDQKCDGPIPAACELLN